MPPRKRAAAKPDNAPKRHKETAVGTTSAGKLQNANAKFSVQAANNWFKKYKEPQEDEIGPAGVLKFCDDLGISPEDISILIIAWQLGAKRAGYFTLEEWTTGMRKLNTDCVTKVKAKKGELRQLIADQKDFKELYRYAFELSREGNQKSLDIDTARNLLQLLLSDRWPNLPYFLTFLSESTYRVINRDQWMNILEFSTSIKSDLSNYDTNGAWPVILDEFAEWKLQQPQPQR